MSTNTLDPKLARQLAHDVVALAEVPDSAVYRSLSETLLQLEQSGEALALCRVGLRKFPGEAALHLLLAQLLSEAGDDRGVLLAATDLLKIEPHNVSGLWLKAASARKLGRRGDAVAAAESLLDLDPGHEQASQLLEELADRPVGGEQAAGQPKQTITTATLAEIYVKQGYLKKAIDVYRELAATDSGNLQLMRRLQELERQLEVTVEKEPLAEEPLAEEPLAEEPLAEEPLAEEPLAEEPLAEEPLAAFEATPYNAVPDSDTAEGARLPREDRLLAVFESWLDAIRQRRSHVH